MKLFEEFKLYENLWDNLQEDSNKTNIDQYFISITSTQEAVVKFVVVKLRQVLDKIDNPTRYDVAREYGKILQIETNADVRDLAIGGKYGYLAFAAKAVDLGISKHMLDQLIYSKATSIDKITNKLLKKSATQETPIKTTLAQYFNEITKSKEAAVNFIANTFRDKIQTPQDAYNYVLAATTTARFARKVQNDLEHNYEAFIRAISKYGLNKKYIRSIAKGVPVTNALEIFEEITSSAESVKSFVQMLSQQYTDYTSSNSRQKHQFIYNKWFISNTNATTSNYFNLIPETVDWSNFVRVCEQKFNYSVHELNALF